MIKHYFHPMSRAMSTNWMLTELDAPHEQILIDFHAGENDTPDYRAINPMGKLPCLEDDGIVVTEVAAICTYLADKFIDKGMAPPVGSTERGCYYRYLFFTGTTMEPMFTINHLGDTDYPAQSVGWGDFDRVIASIETMTPDTDWVMGAKFTAADVVFGGTLDFAVQFGWLKEPSLKIASYIKRIQARPAYRATHDPSWFE